MIYHKAFYSLSTVLIFSVTIMFVRSSAACPNGMLFTKQFTGDVGSIVGNITITNSSTTLFNGPLPASGNITISQSAGWVDIDFTTWQGFHDECVCTNIGYLLNNIPYPPPPPPKFGQQQSSHALHCLLTLA